MTMGINLKNTLLRNMLPSLLPMLPDALAGIEEYINAHLAARELRQGEARATFMLLTGKDGRLYIAEAYINQDDHIVRVESVRNAVEFIQELMQQIK